MIGIFALIANKETRISDAVIKDIVKGNNSGLIFDSVENDNAIVAHNLLDKFQNDQVLYTDDHIILVVDGVILNSKQLMDRYKVNNLKELFLSCINNDSIEGLLSELRGSFCGLIGVGKDIYAFTDQLATKQLFYAFNDGALIVASEVNAIVRYFQNREMPYSLDEVGAYSLMSYAYMYMDHTLIKEIKRLKEGTILRFNEGKIDIREYYKLPEKEISINMDDAIERIDELFLNSVQLQIDKNREYGYCDVIPLSAGMDFRMTAFAAKRITNSPLLNFTYSEFGQEDCYTPGLMARELGNKWLFKNLDNGLDMFNIQESIDIADGLIYYLWPAQLNDVLKLLNTDSWGIVHTGVIGDVILGCWHNKKDGPYILGDGAYSSKLINKLDRHLTEDEKVAGLNYELGMFKNRAINGACMGYSTTFRRYCIDLSPFMNVDFLNFCLSLPFEYRTDHAIYYEWVKKKYPSAAKFKHNGITIKGELAINFKGRKIRIRAIKDLIIRKTQTLQRDIFHKDFGMNPQESWLANNKDLCFEMTNYFNSNKECLKAWPEIYQDACQLFKNGSAIEKSLAISVVGSVKRFFN